MVRYTKIRNSCITGGMTKNEDDLRNYLTVSILLRIIPTGVWLVYEAVRLNEEVTEHLVLSDTSFDHNYIEAFHFRIWHLVTWYIAVVDPHLLVSKYKFVFSLLPTFHDLRCILDDVFLLFEEAYAKVNGVFGSVKKDRPLRVHLQTSFQVLIGGICPV